MTRIAFDLFSMKEYGEARGAIACYDTSASIGCLYTTTGFY